MRTLLIIATTLVSFNVNASVFNAAKHEGESAAPDILKNDGTIMRDHIYRNSDYYGEPEKHRSQYQMGNDQPELVEAKPGSVTLAPGNPSAYQTETQWTNRPQISGEDIIWKHSPEHCGGWARCRIFNERVPVHAPIGGIR